MIDMKVLSPRSFELFLAHGPREASHDTSLHITRENGSKVIGETEGKW